MSQTRTLSNGKSFSVITLPKGTVLFHGFQGDYSGIANETKILSELFGDFSEPGVHCITKHTQKFFYPAPFMGDIVYKYPIYAIYILNYDVNLVSMVLPAKTLHSEQGTSESPTMRCNHIAYKDECGLKYKSSDHCLSQMLLDEHPDIHGYIAIPNNDGSQLKETYPNFVSMTTPMTVSDSKGLVAIPEIVLHPYHIRLSEPRYISERIIDDPIRFILEHISLLNYIPLVYFNESKIFSLPDLVDTKSRTNLLAVERDLSMKAITPLHQNLKIFLDRALSPSGVKINDMIIKFTINLTTGFYSAKYNQIPATKITTNIKILNDNPKKSKDYDVVPFSYPAYMKKYLHRFLASSHTTSEERLTKELARIKSSYNRKYIFDKGNRRKLYELEKAFSLSTFQNKTRKADWPKNYKRTKTLKLHKSSFQVPK